MRPAPKFSFHKWPTGTKKLPTPDLQYNARHEYNYVPYEIKNRYSYKRSIIKLALKLKRRHGFSYFFFYSVI